MAKRRRQKRARKQQRVRRGGVKKKCNRSQYGSGMKSPYSTYSAPYYHQQGNGLPEFWKRSVIPLWQKIRGPLSKAMIFGGRVLRDQSRTGEPLSQAVGSNLGKLLKSGKKQSSTRRKATGKKKASKKSDIFS